VPIEAVFIFVGLFGGCVRLRVVYIFDVFNFLISTRLHHMLFLRVGWIIVRFGFNDFDFFALIAVMPFLGLCLYGVFGLFCGGTAHETFLMSFGRVESNISNIFVGTDPVDNIATFAARPVFTVLRSFFMSIETVVLERLFFGPVLLWVAVDFLASFFIKTVLCVKAGRPIMAYLGIFLTFVFSFMLVW
jgi:hypothetical protein